MTLASVIDRGVRHTDIPAVMNGTKTADRPSGSLQVGWLACRYGAANDHPESAIWHRKTRPESHRHAALSFDCCRRQFGGFGLHCRYRGQEADTGRLSGEVLCVAGWLD